MIVAKSKEVKPGSNLTESSKESNGSKKVCLPMMMLYKLRKYNHSV
jgi:hypothetical protein